VHSIRNTVTIPYTRTSLTDTVVVSQVSKSVASFPRESF
jgi:hypothetical protein